MNTFFHKKQGKTEGFGRPFRKKGNAWYFGYKAHVGVDKDFGLVHTVEATAANEHDVTMMSKLLHGEEETESMCD